MLKAPQVWLIISAKFGNRGQLASGHGEKMSCIGPWFCLIWSALPHDPSGCPCTEAPQGMEISGCTSSIGAAVLCCLDQAMAVTSENQVGIVLIVEKDDVHYRTTGEDQHSQSRNLTNAVKIPFMSTCQFAWSQSRGHGTYCMTWPSPATYTRYLLCVSWQVQCTQWALSLGMHAGYIVVCFLQVKMPLCHDLSFQTCTRPSWHLDHFKIFLTERFAFEGTQAKHHEAPDFPNLKQYSPCWG